MPSSVSMPSVSNTTASVTAGEILLADATLPDLDALLAARRDTMQVWRIDADEDGLAALEAAFAARPHAVHVLAHGTPGEIRLGRRAIDRKRVADAALAGGGTDLLLYGCSTGAGEAGWAFLQALAARTGGAVAAASRPIGDAAQGGSWDLDVAVGMLSVGPAVGEGREGWRHLLAVITGTSGADTLNGTTGNDTLIGGGGADTLLGSDGVDVASYVNATAAVTLNLDVGVHTGDAAGDQYADIEGFVGSNYADSLVGGFWGDWLMGGAGADTLHGGNGADTLHGGNGADTLDGGTGIDTAVYVESLGCGVSVDLSTGTGSGLGDSAGDVLTGIENVVGTGISDLLLGDALANVLNGGGGDDSLGGAAGADTLIGGVGTDTLTGGTGADLFRFTSPSDSMDEGDLIMDFSSAEADRIDLSLIDANGLVANNQAFSFVGTGAFTNVAGQLRYDNSIPGCAMILGDTDGNGIADVTIRLNGNYTLTAAAFVL